MKFNPFQPIPKVYPSEKGYPFNTQNAVLLPRVDNETLNMIVNLGGVTKPKGEMRERERSNVYLQ